MLGLWQYCAQSGTWDYTGMYMGNTDCYHMINKKKKPAGRKLDITLYMHKHRSNAWNFLLQSTPTLTSPNYNHTITTRLTSPSNSNLSI